MTDPKPVAVTYIDPTDYQGPEPQPLAIVGADPNGETTSVTSAGITEATTIGKAVLTAATQADARTAIAAGTSNLALAQSQAGIATKTQIAVLATNTTASAAASVAKPTKAEFDTVVTPVNSLKNSLNAIVTALKA